MKRKRGIQNFLTEQIFSLFILFCLCGLLPLPVAVSESASEAPPQFAWELVKMQWHFSYPRGVAVDMKRNVYIVDTDNCRIQKFNYEGILLATWGSRGGGDGQFSGPYGVAVDGNGNVYVADTYNNRIQKFGPDGIFLSTWGSHGSGDGQFIMPYGVAVDESGNVYVTDYYNHRVQKFSPDGTFLVAWGSEGSGDGQFKYPSGLTVDGNGNVYVADSHNHRIQKFSSDGGFLAKWGAWGTGDVQFLSNPSGLAVDWKGNVYVADNRPIDELSGSGLAGDRSDDQNHLIYKFNSRGVLLAAWGSYGSGVGQFKGPCGVAVDGNANIYVADSQNHRIQKFNSEGGFLTVWGSMGDDWRFSGPSGIAVDWSGNVYVADSYNHRIQKLGFSGMCLSWGSMGSGNEKFSYPHGIAVDGNGNFYVIADGIKKFSPDGIFLTKWKLEKEESVGGSSGSGSGQSSSPQEIAVDWSGNVYVTDTDNYIWKFSSDGVFLTKWESYKSGDGQSFFPSGIAVDWSGNVYVLDIYNPQVQKFSSNGVFLTMWSTFGPGDGQLVYPTGIAADGSGNVYVADLYNACIKKFSSDGAFLTKWGSYGSGDGQFYSPRGVAVDWSGNVYVADTHNNRIQKFTYPNSTDIPPSEAPYAPPGTMLIGEIRGIKGKEIRVPVMLQDVSSALSVFGFEVIYDVSVLEYTGFESGDLAESFQGESFQGESFQNESFRGLNPDPVYSGIVEEEGFAIEVSEVEGLGIQVTIEGNIPKKATGCLVWLKFKVKGGTRGNCYPLKIGSMWDDLNHGISIMGRFCILDQCDGDINGDGSVTPQDALIAFGCFLDHNDSDHTDSDHTDSCPQCADIDNSGDITPADALCILREYLGAPSCLDER